MPNKLSTIRPLKRTKIVVTIGPASDKEETLRRMILGGLDAVRVNFSHSSHDYIIPLVKRIRTLGDKMGVPIAIIGDLQGPRILNWNNCGRYRYLEKQAVIFVSLPDKYQETRK